MVKINMELPECCALCPCCEEVSQGGLIWSRCVLGRFVIKTDIVSFRDKRCMMEAEDEKTV